MSINQFSVNFGNILAPEGFGFIHGGTVAVENDYIIFNGERSWSLGIKLAIICLLTLVMYFVGFMIGWLILLVLVNYLAVTKNQTLSIPRESIAEVKRTKRAIRFKGRCSKTGKVRKSFFAVDTLENAVILEDLLNGRIHSTARH